MEKIRFYSAYVRTDVNEPFVFGLEEIKKVYPDGTIELHSPYFIYDQYSTYFFAGKSGNAIDREYALRHGCAFYSTDKHKCMDYLVEKRKELVDYCDKVHGRLQESKITTKYLDDKSMDRECCGTC